MTPLVLLSILGIFLICFGVVIFFLRATKMETALQKQLDTVSEGYRGGVAAATILKEDKLSPNPQIHDLLARTPIAVPLLRLIKQAAIPWWVSSVVLNSVFLAVGGCLLTALMTRSFVPAFLATVLLGLSPIGYLLFLRKRRFTACTKLLPDAVDLMARSLRAGHALNSALQMVSTDVGEPLASEFRTVYDEQTLGLPLRDALENLTQRLPVGDMEFLCAALMLQRETGGNLAQILDKTSALMRDRVRLRGQIRTVTAQARASGWILAMLPFVMFFLMNAVSPGYESMLLNDPLGMKLIYAGLVMLAIGALVIRKIVDIKI